MIIFWQHPNVRVAPEAGEFVDAEFDTNDGNCLTISVKSKLFQDNWGGIKMACSYGNIVNPETGEVIWDGSRFRIAGGQEQCPLPDPLLLAVRYANWKKERSGQ